MSADIVTILFEGRPVPCRAETSVAAGLWEAGIRHLSRSPKYGRPRGVTCARGQCTACLMRVDGVPNVRTCETPVREGLAVSRQDAGAPYAAPLQKSLSLGGRLFPVGFYYKWFTRPAFLSRFFLRMIRPLTGVGRLPAATPARGALPAESLGSFPTVVVGAGVAGLEAAAAASGPVLVLDENAAPGGLRLQALEELAAAPGARLERFPGLDDARTRLVEARAALDRPDVTLRGGARVVAGFSPGGLVVRQGETLATVQGEHVVWAAGALDVLGIFPGNDTAGALGPRALLRLLVRDRLDVTGRHALLVGQGLDMWLCANLLEARGARVSLVVTSGGMQSEVSAAVDRGWSLHTGLDLAGLRGLDQKTVRAEFTPGRRQPGPVDSHLRLDADLVVVCHRGKPTYDIPYQLGAPLELDPARGGFVAGDEATGCRLTVAGEAVGLPPEELLAAVTEVE